MNERESGGCFNASVILLLIVLCWFLLLQGVKDHFELRNLQRRVAELEQKR